MALLATQPLPVATITSTSLTSSLLTFTMHTPYLAPFHIGCIIIRRTRIGHTTGSISPGADTTDGGTVRLSVNAATFTALRAKAILPFRVVLNYDTLADKVIGLDILPDPAGVSPSP
jgi:hypothetical protein